MTDTYHARLWSKPSAVDVFFVPAPGVRGHYLKVDRSVVMVGCQHCGSPVGVPCSGAYGYKAGTHFVRRKAATRMVRKQRQKQRGEEVRCEDPAAR